MQKVLLSVAVVLVGSFAVAATIFLKFSPNEEVKALDTIPTPTAPIQATCQIGFTRPLIFGVSGDGSPSTYEGDLKKAGSTTAGIGIHWDTIQPNGPDNYDPEMVNFPIRKASQSGLVIVVNVSGTPAWASDNPGMEARKALPNKANTTVVSEFKELVTQAVHDNKDKAKYWSYGNEPNGCGSNTGSCGYTHDSAEDYAWWFNLFYDTVKAADPDAKVILGPIEFTKNDTSYISLMNDMVPKYDYLGITVYNKHAHSQFPLDWAKAAYDRQKTKQPIFITEWGFDTKWWCDDSDEACVASARQEIAGLIEDGLNKIKASDWIYAAKYHNLRDGGGDGNYGIWEKDGPRPGGTKFLEMSKNICNAQFSQNGTPITPPPSSPPPATAACVIESHDIGGDLLKRGDPVTLTSIVSAPATTFTYSFYNRDNKDSNGIPKPICVAGLAHTDGCPQGSGRLVISLNADRNTGGAIQAVSWLKTPNGKVIDSVWRGDMGWNRTLPLDSSFGLKNSTPWNFSSNLVSNVVSPDLSTSEIDALDFYNTGATTGVMEIWRNNRLSKTTFKYNSAGDYPDWSTGQTSTIVDLNKPDQANKIPGSGKVTAAGSFVIGNNIWQMVWRGKQEFMRTAPLANASKFDNPNYQLSRSIGSLPVPMDDVQAVTYMVMPSSQNQIQEELWQNGAMFRRFIPIVNNAPDFAHATSYIYNGDDNALTQTSNLNNSLVVAYKTVHVADANNGGKMVENVQVNATFDTTAGHVGDDGKCVVRFGFAKSIDGDANGDCVNDIYDYNVLLQYYGTTNCAYNLTGDCKIDDADIKYLKDRFGNKCS